MLDPLREDVIEDTLDSVIARILTVLQSETFSQRSYEP